MYYSHILCYMNNKRNSPAINQANIFSSELDVWGHITLPRCIAWELSHQNLSLCELNVYVRHNPIVSDLACNLISREGWDNQSQQPVYTPGRCRSSVNQVKVVRKNYYFRNNKSAYYRENKIFKGHCRTECLWLLIFYNYRDTLLTTFFSRSQIYNIRNESQNYNLWFKIRAEKPNPAGRINLPRELF